MNKKNTQAIWQSGTAPVAVVMISLNEGHNMDAVLENLSGWAQEVFLVDSYSQDNTLDIALKHGVHVVQRRFRGFGDQWNFALRELPITTPWTMKLDPDERLSDELKTNIIQAIEDGQSGNISLSRHLWFMQRPLPIRQKIIRLWETDTCSFNDVLVNEHPLVEGEVVHVEGELVHHDSPDLEHWLDKQNRYTTAEAIIRYQASPLADTPKLFGSSLQKRMWLKKNYNRLPFRFFWLFLYYWLVQGVWRAGWVGFVWARLRSNVMLMVEYKYQEMRLTGKKPVKRLYGPGLPDPRVEQRK